MAKTGGFLAEIYVNGYDLTEFLNAASPSKTAEVYDVTTFRKQWMEFIAGRTSGNFNIAGFYIGDDGYVGEILYNALAVKPSIWSVMMQGDGQAKLGYGFPAIETQITITMPTNGVVTISGSGVASSSVDLIVVLHPLGAETAPEDGTAVDNGASTNNGGTGYVHVTDFDGTDATIKIKKSTDNVTYTDLLTFAQVTSEHTAERKEVAGTVPQYLRYNLSGTFNSITLQVGFYRNPSTV